MEDRNREYLKTLFALNKIHPSKALGQNFLTEADIAAKIAESSHAASGFGVIEVGPGTGSLTRELALRCDKVVAVELDRELIPLLNRSLGYFSNIALIQGDIFRLGVGKLVKEHFPSGNAVMCSNLPYYITTPAIIEFLKPEYGVKGVSALIQKEAAERFMSKPGDVGYGVSALIVQYFAEPVPLFDVPPEAFYPSPNIQSTFMRFNIRNRPPVEVDNEARFFNFIKTAFGHRRKTLANNIADLCGGRGKADDIIRSAGLESGIRAEMLGMAKFAEIYRMI